MLSLGENKIDKNTVKLQKRCSNYKKYIGKDFLTAIASFYSKNCKN